MGQILALALLLTIFAVAGDAIIKIAGFLFTAGLIIVAAVAAYTMILLPILNTIH